MMEQWIDKNSEKAELWKGGMGWNGREAKGKV